MSPGSRSVMTHRLAVSGAGCGPDLGEVPQSAVKRFGLNAGSTGSLGTSRPERGLDLAFSESR